MNSSEPEKVLPTECPFCGSKDTRIGSYGEDTWFYVACNECAASGPEASSATEAIRAWESGRTSTTGQQTSTSTTSPGNINPDDVLRQASQLRLGDTIN